MILATLLASFLPPASFAVAILLLTGTAIVHRGVQPSSPLPEGSITMMALWLPFAALAVLGPTFVHGHGGQNFQASKFFFAWFALILGVLLGNQRDGLRSALPIFVGLFTAYYGVLFFTDASLNQEASLYPPDNNNSAAMLSVFLPVILLRMGGWIRVTLLALIVVFAFFVASRLLLALSLLALASSPRAIRERKYLLLGAFPLSLAILFHKGFSLDNFSDQLRMQILQVSYNYAIGRGFHAFNFGERAFTDFLNIYPIYRRLEIEHAHNLFLQIWVAYGWAPLIAFFAWLANFVRIAWRDRNELLLASLTLFLTFGMIEAIITDTRSFSIIMFLLGYVYARGYVERGVPGAPTTPPAKESPQAVS